MDFLKAIIDLADSAVLPVLLFFIWYLDRKQFSRFVDSISDTLKQQQETAARRDTKLQEVLEYHARLLYTIDHTVNDIKEQTHEYARRDTAGKRTQSGIENEAHGDRAEGVGPYPYDPGAPQPVREDIQNLKIKKAAALMNDLAALQKEHKEILAQLDQIIRDIGDE